MALKSKDNTLISGRQVSSSYSERTERVPAGELLLSLISHVCSK